MTRSRLTVFGLLLLPALYVTSSKGLSSPMENGQELRPGEFLMTTDLTTTPPADARSFLSDMTLAFVGRIESMQVAIARKASTFGVYTVLTFRPTEVIKSDNVPSPDGLVEIWTFGGSYFLTPSGPRPGRPIGVTLQRDGSYFVAARTNDEMPELEGHYVLPAYVTLVRVDQGQPISANGETDWPAAVIAKSAGGRVVPTERQAAAFLDAMRRAAAGGKQ